MAAAGLMKRARISLAGAVAPMIFTDSHPPWNDNTHDIDEAASYLEGSGISWRELLPRVRAELERDWPRVSRLTEALLARQQLSGTEAAAVIEAA